MGGSIYFVTQTSAVWSIMQSALSMQHMVGVG